MSGHIAGCFLGSKAENIDLLRDLIDNVLVAHGDSRRNYFPNDPNSISQAAIQSEGYSQAIQKLKDGQAKILDLLNKYSIPFFSGRYAGHICADPSLSAIIGWLSTALYNPNNIAFEASPITTLFELEAGKDMCKMIGYPVERKYGYEDQGWGHVTAGGTISNIESIWVARNLKFYPLSLRETMKPGRPLAFIADDFKIRKCDSPSERSLFKDLTTWELLNLRPKEILDLPHRLQMEHGITRNFLEKAITPYIVQTLSRDVLEKEYGVERPVQYLVSCTKHYSWPKGAALTGIGSQNMVNIPVDLEARLDTAELRRKIEELYQKKQAVYAVVAVMGTSEVSAVDALDEVLEIREEYQGKGMSFLVHADAAWGGYFASMIRGKNGEEVDLSGELPERTAKQLKAMKNTDSVTLDPHKSGYVPYPAGGLCYRDGRMRFLVSWSAPYIQLSTKGDNIGIYGIAGSKPGSAASSVWLHHLVLGLYDTGHGVLLKKVGVTCKLMALSWACLVDSAAPYTLVPFKALRSEAFGFDALDEEKQRLRKKFQDIKKAGPGLEFQRLMEDLEHLQPDLTINGFACNFKIDGKINDDVEEANYLNNRIFQRYSITTPDKTVDQIPLFLAATTLRRDIYGDCATNYMARIGLETKSGQDIFMLRNLVISPLQIGAIDIIMDEFERGLAIETKHVIRRNTYSMQILEFLMEGTDKIYLVLLPWFHNINRRTQLILEVSLELLSAHGIHILKTKEGLSAHGYFILKTKGTLPEILKLGYFIGTIVTSDGKTVATDVKVKIVKVVKNRSLRSNYRDRKYPNDYMPFYLYGPKTQPHIDHMLLRAPNVQICVEDVKLNLDNTLTDDELGKGLIVHLLDVHEASMQPISQDVEMYWRSIFRPNRTFDVVVYSDPNEAEAQGPGLDDVGDETPLATGKLTLVGGIFMEYRDLNRQEEKGFAFSKDGYTSRNETVEMRQLWKGLLAETFELDPGNGLREPPNIPGQQGGGMGWQSGV